MDLNPIPVLTATPPASPANSGAAGAPAESFSDLLSAQQGPGNHPPVPEPKASNPASNNGRKEAPKKAATTGNENPKQDQKPTEQAVPTGSLSCSNPTPCAGLPILTPVALGLSPFFTADPAESSQTPGQQATDAIQNNPAGLVQAPIPTSAQPVPGTSRQAFQVTPQQQELPTDRSGLPAVSQSKVPQEPAPVGKMQATPARDQERAAKPDAVQSEFPPLDGKAEAIEVSQVVAAAILDSAAAPPVVPDTPNASVSNDPVGAARLPQHEPNTSTVSPRPPVAADDPVSALKLAAEKLGSVASAVAHIKAGESRMSPASPALGTSSAPVKMGASAPRQAVDKGSHSESARSREGFHVNIEKQAPAISEQSATADSKPASDDTPQEVAPPAGVLNKDGSQTAAATNPQATSAQLKNGAPSGPADSVTQGNTPRQTAPALPFGRTQEPGGTGFDALSMTSLIERFRQSELRFGIQSGEFGRIEVRTMLDHHEVSARISVERGDLGQVLASELPGLQKRLSDLDVPMARITVHEQSAAMSNESGRRSREQEAAGWQPARNSEPVAASKVAPLLELPTTTEGLSIRI